MFNWIIARQKIILIFINLFVLLILFLCCLLNYESLSLRLIFFYIILFILYNISLYLFFIFIRQEEKRRESLKSEYLHQIKQYFDKIATIYGAVELNKRSFGVYHDIANLLSSLNLILQESEVSKCSNCKIHNYLHDCIHISHQLNNLLSFLKKQSCNKDISLRFRVSEELNNCFALFSYYFYKHNIKLKHNLLDDLCLIANPLKFNQIFINLLSNSMEAFSSCEMNKHKLIYVRMYIKDKFLNIIFKDNGPGINEADLDHVFDLFFSTKQNSCQNCGFGLFLVKKIVEEDFSGSIKLKSDIGKGVKFVIKIALN